MISEQGFIIWENFENIDKYSIESLANQSRNYLTIFKNEMITNISPYLSNINNGLIIPFLIEIVCSENENKSSYFSIAVSILEKCIFDMCKEHNFNVPTSITKLLKCDYLNNILNNSFVKCLRMMFSSNEFNLRNLAWHGFFKIPLDYGFLIIFFITEIMRNNEFKILKLFDLDCFKINVNNFEILKESEISKLIENTNFTKHKIQKSLIKIFEGYEFEGLCILIPIFEHSLRLIYCKLNDSEIFPKTHYTTLDGLGKNSKNLLLCERIGENENKLYTILGEGLRNIINDIFVKKLGPHLRSGLAHGIVKFKLQQKELSNLTKVFIQIFISCCLLFSESDFTNSLHPKNNNFVFKNYKSKYSSYSIFETKLLKLKYKLRNVEKEEFLQENLKITYLGFSEEINFENLVQKEELIERIKHFEIEDLFVVDFEIPNFKCLKSIICYCNDILDLFIEKKKSLLHFVNLGKMRQTKIQQLIKFIFHYESILLSLNFFVFVVTNMINKRNKESEFLIKFYRLVQNLKSEFKDGQYLKITSMMNSFIRLNF